ncbi:MAG TPA: amino acid adenylation domain-containing protein, partial [Candidatus Angelobacter sp.]|nr:amino acid adenylation domain-containing protein [Candidatus Angelobacter sp.]
MSNTVARLAALSPERRKLFEQRLRGSSSPIIPRRSGNDRLPLSFAQQRLWFLDQLVPGNPFYNIPGATRLNFPLNVDVLRRSLNEIVRRHESLRTTFSMADGTPMQVIAPALILDVPITDLRSLPQDRREAEAVKQATEEARTPFDLTKGPLIRARLLQLDTQDFFFLLTIHHIVSDGWSMGIFFQELDVLYTCFATGQASPLRELPIQYADFALWQRGWVKGEVLERQLSYWSERLAGIPTLDLPADRVRPAIPSFRGDICPLTAPLEVMQRLKDLSGECEATLFMTLLAAFHTLLHRYSGQDVIAVGSPVANRNRPDIEGLIGFFVNSLVLRADFEENPSFHSLLAQVRQTAIGAYANQDLPFEMLVEQLQPERDLSRNPLFQVIFQLMNAPTMAGQAAPAPAATTPPLNVQVGTSKFDLNITMFESSEGLIGTFEYNTDLFDVSTIVRMVAHYQTLLESIAANPQRRISELSILTPAERRQILVDWNRTQSEYPAGRSLGELFEEQAAKRPQSPAVRFGQRELSYSELNARANHLAWYLRSLNVGRGSHVGICVERSPEMIVATLAVVKSGGAYVPLDPDYPQDRLAFMMEDAQLQALITQGNLLDHLPHSTIPVICFERDAELLDSFSPENPATVNQADDLAYVMYTSGSTGTPKGVCVLHRAIGRLVLNTDYVRFSPGDRIAQVSNFSFDAATFEIWGALLNGGQLVGFEKETLLSAFDFAAELARCQISAMFLTTALFNQLAREDASMFSSVRNLLVGGEALDPKWIRRVLESEPPARLLNGYGPTEATTFAVCHLIQNVPAGASSVPIGRPIANTVVYILDKYGQPVPAGVRGELYIGGPGVARGYWKRPELTAQRFIRNPFREDDDEVLYKTGDLVRYLPDGCIEFISRIDNQV